MPSLIETRPFTIRPELFAWPSYRIFSERAWWLYVVLLVALTFLLTAGLQLSVTYGLMTAVMLIAIAFAFTYLRYKAFLSKSENRDIYRNCVVSLTDEAVRQDYTDGSYLEMQLFAVKTFRDLGGFYFVFANPKQGIVVPKTSFESIEDSSEFASRLRQGMRPT